MFGSSLSNATLPVWIGERKCNSVNHIHSCVLRYSSSFCLVLFVTECMEVECSRIVNNKMKKREVKKKKHSSSLPPEGATFSDICFAYVNVFPKSPWLLLAQRWREKREIDGVKVVRARVGWESGAGLEKKTCTWSGKIKKWVGKSNRQLGGMEEVLGWFEDERVKEGMKEWGSWKDKIKQCNCFEAIVIICYNLLS